MNNLISNVTKENHTIVLERYTFACLNHMHSSIESPDVRHRTLSQDLIHKTYLVTDKDNRKVPSIFWGVVEPTFSTNGVIS